MLHGLVIWIDFMKVKEPVCCLELGTQVYHISVQQMSSYHPFGSKFKLVHREHEVFHVGLAKCTQHLIASNILCTYLNVDCNHDQIRF